MNRQLWHQNAPDYANDRNRNTIAGSWHDRSRQSRNVNNNSLSLVVPRVPTGPANRGRGQTRSYYLPTGPHSSSPAQTHRPHRDLHLFKQESPLPQPLHHHHEAPRRPLAGLPTSPMTGTSLTGSAMDDHASHPPDDELSKAQQTYTYNVCRDDPWPEKSDKGSSETTRQDVLEHYRKKKREDDARQTAIQELVYGHGSKSTFDLGSSARAQSSQRAHAVVAKDTGEKPSDGRKQPVPIPSPTSYAAMTTAPAGAVNTTKTSLKDLKFNKKNRDKTQNNPPNRKDEEVAAGFGLPPEEGEIVPPVGGNAIIIIESTQQQTEPRSDLVRRKKMKKADKLNVKLEQEEDDDAGAGVVRPPDLPTRNPPNSNGERSSGSTVSTAAPEVREAVQSSLPPKKKKEKKEKKEKKGGEESSRSSGSTNAAMVETDAQGGSGSGGGGECMVKKEEGKEEGGEGKKRASVKRKSVLEAAGDELGSRKKRKKANNEPGSQRSVEWSLVVAGKTKLKTKKSNVGHVPLITLGRPPPPARILRPTIWAASRSELVLVLPELGHSRSYNGITQGSSNYPMVLLDESTAEGIGVEIIHPTSAAAAAALVAGEYPCVRLTLRREFNCTVDELLVGSAIKNESEAEEEEEKDQDSTMNGHPAPPPALIPRTLPPEVEILIASRGLSYPIILVSSKEVFDQAFLTANPNVNARVVGLADEHAYVFWGFFLIKKVEGGSGGGRLVTSSWDMDGVVSDDEQQQPQQAEERRVRGVAEWVFDVEWAPQGVGIDARPWWAEVFPFPDASDSAARLYANLHLNLVPTQLADGQEEGSADECMPRGWLCKRCGRLNPKLMMRHRWCSAVWMGCKGEALSRGYAVPLDDARDPRQTPLALPINVWDENRVDVRVADWDDGMRTVKYRPMSQEAVLARRNEEEAVEWTGEGGLLKHVFTCNAEDLQREATPLFARIQEEVCLSKKTGDSGTYFKCDISDKYAGRNGFSSKTWGEAPQSVHDARSLMEFMGRSYGEDGGFAVKQMTITGWVSSGARKASETVAGKAGTVGMMCLGNDVILTIMPNWGPDTPSMSVTLVHGDMLLFSGCDYEYSIKRLGTSLLLVGG